MINHHIQRPMISQENEPCQRLIFLPLKVVQAFHPCQRILVESATRRPSDVRGTVNLIDCGRAGTRRSGQTRGWLCQSDNPGHLGPPLESLGPGGSILRGGKVIAAEVKEVVDLSVGGEETLSLSV